MKDLIYPALLSLLLLASPSASAAKLSRCSIHPAKSAKESEFPNLAKVTEEDAKKVVLSDLKLSSDTALAGELEAERGCLIYSFDVTIPGHPGVEEVWVDAGTGKILSREHESAAKVAAEKLLDRK